MSAKRNLSLRGQLHHVETEANNSRSDITRNAETIRHENLGNNYTEHRTGLETTVAASSKQSMTAPTQRETSDIIVLTVDKWEELDRKCYITKAMEYVREEVSKDESNYMTVTGVPGSGKTTTIQHAAIWLKNGLGFTVYPILSPADFEKYFDKNRRQVFVYDDVVGEYKVERVKFACWNRYNDRIKTCLSPDTKFLTSSCSLLLEDGRLKGKNYLFTDRFHRICLSDAEFKLNKVDMEDMLRHFLDISGVENIDILLKQMPWQMADSFVEIFPLLCKIYSQNQSVRQKSHVFFKQPFKETTEIFRQINIKNKHQFCGLVLCSALDLNEDYFSHLYESELPADKLQLRNAVIELYELNTKQDLTAIKSAVESLDGVYITRVGKVFKFSHSLFQNIVTSLCDDSSFVFKYKTCKFICDNVRIKQKLADDNDYVLVYDSETDIHKLVDRFVRELVCDANQGVVFLTNYPCVDDHRLISNLRTQLFNHKDFDKHIFDLLCWRCVDTLCFNRPRGTDNLDITIWHGYRLLEMLLQGGADCNTQIGVRGMCGIHLAVYYNCIPVTEFLLKYNADINILDNCNCCVLHYAATDLDMTLYLLSLRSLTCLNQPDCDSKTPYWYATWNQSVGASSDGCSDYDRQQIINLYRDKGAVLFDVKE